MQAAGWSDVGRERVHNEDTFVVDDVMGLYGVCDGMGGHAAGEVAAAVALDAASRTVRHRPWIAETVKQGKGSPERLVTLLDKAAKTANAEVYGLTREYPPYEGMGCTLTLLLTAGNQAALASVGDSRFYLLRHGRAQQLTLDHTMGEELKRVSGAMTPQLAASRYARMLSRAIGVTETVRADIFQLELVPGDRFIVCTDGLSDYITSELWLTEQLSQGGAAQVAQRLVQHANASGGEDNITVVVGVVEN